MQRLLPLVFALSLISASCGSADESVTSGSSADPIGDLTGQPGEEEPSTTDPTAPVDVTPTADATTLIGATSTDRAEPSPDAPADALAASFTNAGFDILRDQPLDENAILSPVSIGHAVLMARAAADDATGAAIDDALVLPTGLSAHDAWNTIALAIDDINGTTEDFNGAPTPIVNIADRIWPAQGITPNQNWVDLLATHHGSDVSTIDVTQPEASRDEINSWVAHATEGLIPELLPPGFIASDTTLVLTNAIYFKAEWQQIFGKYGTVDADFTTLDGSTVPTTFMRELEGAGERGTGDGWTAAELPYSGDGYSMLVLIPDSGRYEEIRNGLSAGLLDTIDSTISPGPYELLLPKWEDTTNIDLLSWLTEIGAAPGNYPAISSGTILSGGIHGADIAVDEWGTVAAAATGLGFRESGPPEPHLTVAADRPFFYLIRHRDTGLVLFTGQVTNPNV